MTENSTNDFYAKVLIEAVPYIKKFAGETFVIKYGGSTIGNEECLKSFAEDVSEFQCLGPIS